MCRLICSGRTVFIHGPLPYRAGASQSGSGGHFRSVPGRGRKGAKALPWHNGNERKKLAARQERMAEEYRSAGMTEEAIAQIAAFDLEVLRSDRRLYRHSQALCPGVGDPGAAPEPAADGREFPLSGRMDWLQEIEPGPLLEALMDLSPEMLEILTLYVFEGWTQPEIARKLGCTPQNISNRFVRMRRFLRRRTARAAEEKGTAAKCRQDGNDPSTIRRQNVGKMSANWRTNDGQMTDK